MGDNKKVIIGSVLLSAVLLVGIYVNRMHSFAPSPEQTPPPAPAAAAPAPAAPAAPAAPMSSLPTLEDSDAAVRARAAAFSSDARFADWLKKDDLIQRFAAALNMIAQGKVPSDSLAFLAPHKKFSVRTLGDKIDLDPRGYARYDAVGDVVGSVDAAAAAKLFRDFQPLFQQAYQGLGEKNSDVMAAFQRASAKLTGTPVLEGGIALSPAEKGIVYRFADADLEKLDPVQKQLLRMGPRNEKKIQTKLREIQAALNAN